jgi:adenine-specific DNA-methyltransferase
MEPLRVKLNAALKTNWQEWEIPRDAETKWPEATRKLHAEWWQARIARQKEIDASIAAKAEFEYLYDKPYDNKKPCVLLARSRWSRSARTACWAWMKTMN